MKKKIKFILFFLIFIDILLFGWLFLHGNIIALLNPKGMIALRERNILIVSVLLMLIAVVPAYILLFTFARKYRVSNRKANYTFDAKQNKVLLIFVWALPSAVILVLSVLNWKNTHVLDPYRPIVASEKPLTIQVVALQWKWLFIYPQQHIATVNFIEFPQRTPIHFELTADDAPMNLFWIPQLGGQMAAMAGMITQHNLIADEKGEFAGSAAEMNGRGFAGMKFIAKSTSREDFAAWVQFVKASPQSLTLDNYNTLVRSTENNPVSYYSFVDDNLYHGIAMKYMTPIKPTMSNMQQMIMKM